MSSSTIDITGEVHTYGKGVEQPDLEEPRPRGNKARVDDSPEPLCASIAGVAHTFNGGVVDAYFAIRDSKYDSDSIRRTVIGRCNSQQGASEAVIGRDLDMLLSGGVNVSAKVPLISDLVKSAVLIASLGCAAAYGPQVTYVPQWPLPRALCGYTTLLELCGWEACRNVGDPRYFTFVMLLALILEGFSIQRTSSVFVGWKEAVQTVLETRSSYVCNPRLLRLRQSSINKVARMIESTHVDRTDGWVTIRDESYGDHGAAVLRAGPLTFGTPPRLVENTDWDLTNTLNKRCKLPSPDIDTLRWAKLHQFAMEMTEHMPDVAPYSVDEFLASIDDAGKRLALAEATPDDLKRLGQVFVKREKVSSFGYVEEGSQKARVVFTRNAYYQREVGRYTKAYSKQLADWSTLTPHVWTYGWNAEEVGEINPASYPWSMEGDMSAFDARITTPHLKLELDMYGAVGFSGGVVELMMSGMNCKMASRIGRIDAGVQRRSGDPNTSLGNSLLNMVITTHILQVSYGTPDYASTCQRMLENGTKFFVMGDDIIMVSRTPVFIDFAAEYAKYGLVHKPIVRQGADTAFTTYLSGLFYPTSSGVIWGPQPAAITRAFWYDRSPSTKEQKVRALARADALNRQRSCGFIPIVAAACSRVLQLTARESAARLKEVNNVSAPTRQHGADNTTYDFVAAKLGVSVDMLRDAEDKIRSAPDGTHVDHEVFDRALASAGKVVDSSTSSGSQGRPKWSDAPCVIEVLKTLRLERLKKFLPGPPTLRELTQVLRANYYFMSDGSPCLAAPRDSRKPDVVVMGPGSGEPFGHIELSRIEAAKVDPEAFSRLHDSTWFIGAPKRKPVYAPRRNKGARKLKRERKPRVTNDIDKSTFTVEFILATLSPSDWSLHFAPREMADNIRVPTLNWDKWQIRNLELRATSHSNAFATGAYVIGWTPDSRENLVPRSYADLASRSHVAKAKARESTTLRVPAHALPKQLFLDDADNSFPYATMGGQFFYRSAGSSTTNPTVVELWLKATIVVSDRQIITGVSDRTVLPSLSVKNNLSATYKATPGFYASLDQLRAGLTRQSGAPSTMEPGAWHTPWYPWLGSTTYRDTRGSDQIDVVSSITSENRSHGMLRSKLQELINAAMPKPLSQVLDVAVEAATIGSFGPVGTALKFINKLGIPLLVSVADTAYTRHGLPITNEPYEDAGTVFPWGGAFETEHGFVGMTHDNLNGTTTVFTTLGDAIYDSASRGCAHTEKRDCSVDVSLKGSVHSTGTYSATDVFVVPGKGSITWMTVPSDIQYPPLGAYHGHRRSDGGSNPYVRAFAVGSNMHQNVVTSGVVSDVADTFGNSYHLASDPAVRGGTRMKLEAVPGDTFEARWDTSLFIEAQPAPTLASQVREYASFVSFDDNGKIVIDPSRIPKLTLADRYRADERTRHKRGLYRSVGHVPRPESEHKLSPIGLFTHGTLTDAEYRQRRETSPAPVLPRVRSLLERKSDTSSVDEHWEDEEDDESADVYDDDEWDEGPAAGGKRFKSTNPVDGRRRAPPSARIAHPRVRTVTYRR